MSDDRDKKRSAWNQAAAGDDKKLGLSADVLRKLKQMNPALADGANTADFMKKVQGELRPQATGRPSQDSLAQQMLVLRSEVDNKRKKVAEETKRLEASLQVTVVEAREKLMAALLRIDPGLTSPMTRELLDDHKEFLNEIGFTMAGLIEKSK